ncbi:MAG TPA: glycosyltransferase family 4 protein, partial [Candidatus Thermoplasmatota archaeon]|nr:glycosyltransferase family 4 protein [Candidatus Thermoplasmatota archaeon]
MKVVLVGAGMIEIPPPGYGGVENHIANLARHLPAAGVEVEVMNRVFGAGGRNEYRFARWARRALRGTERDVVHVHTSGVGAVFAALGPQYAYTSHSRHWMSREGWRERFGFAMERRAVRGAAGVVALSPTVADLLAREGVRAEVIPTGVDVHRYTPGTRPKSGSKVVALGVVAPHKQLHVAAKALEGSEARLVLLGPVRDAAYANRLRERGADVRGELPPDEILEELRSADVFVHPSTSENLPGAVLEAMACGLPCVVTDACAGQVVAGVGGEVVPASAPEEERVRRFGDAVRSLLADDARREAWGRAARERAVEVYAWEAVA